jgi:outer membrane autotransporter protein
VLRSWVDSKQQGGFGTLHYDTDRWQASAAVNGYWYSGTWRFNPALTLSWSKDFENEKNGLTPDRTIETGVLTPSLQVGKTFRLSDAVTAEPWAGAFYDWSFLSDTHTSGAGTVSTPDADLRLQAGLNFGFGSNAQLALTGEVAGLMEGNLNTYALEANLAIQF